MTLQEALTISWQAKRLKYPNMDTEKFGENVQYHYVCRSQHVDAVDFEDLFATDWEPIV